GSDLEMVQLGPMPCTLGHEFAGLTDDGTEVAVQPYAACGHCDECARNQPHHCAQVGTKMYGISIDGGMADEVWVDRSCLSPLPHGGPAKHASLVEPIAVVLHACNRANVEAGMRVAVVGAGSIGLLGAAVARHLGADVTIAARHKAQQAAAEELGIALDPTKG